MKSEVGLMDTLWALSVGVATFGACLALRALLDVRRDVRMHNPGCVTCPRHRRRDPKVATLAARRGTHAHG